VKGKGGKCIVYTRGDTKIHLEPCTTVPGGPKREVTYKINAPKTMNTENDENRNGRGGSRCKQEEKDGQEIQGTARIPSHELNKGIIMQRRQKRNGRADLMLFCTLKTCTNEIENRRTAGAKITAESSQRQGKRHRRNSVLRRILC